MSPRPSIPKLEAASPFSKMSIGNITIHNTNTLHIYMKCNENNYPLSLRTLDGCIQSLGNCYHDVCAKHPKDVVDEKPSEQQTANQYSEQRTHTVYMCGVQGWVVHCTCLRRSAQWH